VKSPVLSGASGKRGHRRGRGVVALLGLLLLAGGCADGDRPVVVPGETDLDPVLPDAAHVEVDGGVAADGGASDLGDWPDLAPFQERRPSVTRVDPAAGPATGGQSVLLEGTGFIHATAVLLGGQPVTTFQVLGPDRLRVVTPAAPAIGSVDVEVRTASAVGVLVAGYRYHNRLQLDRVEPAVAPVAGGTQLRVHGAGFADGVELVVGQGRCWDVVVESDATVLATLPANPPGLADLWAFARGESAPLHRALRYREPPRIEGITPRVGPLAGGTFVQLTGAGLEDDVQVVLGSQVVRVSGDGDATARRFVTPPATRTGPVDLLVRTGVGETTVSDGFVYLDPAQTEASLQAVTPGQGASAGGTSVSLLGQGLLPEPTVLFDRTPASCVTLDPQTVSCVTPAHVAGLVPVVLRQADGALLSLPGGFRYLEDLTLTRVSPQNGPEEGGVAVELTGSGFHPEAVVLFGSTPATGVRVHGGGTRLSGVLPPGAAGPVDVTVVQGAQRVTLPGAFGYEGRLRLLTLAPPEGSIAGNTLVRLIGTGFRPGLPVIFGGQPLTDVQYVSSSLLMLRTPPVAAETTIDVQIPGEALLPAAYTYFDPYNRAGGVWGGPIDGAVNVAIRDSYTGRPIVGATLLLGPDPLGGRSGGTDERGLVTLSELDLVGPQDLHAGHVEYEPGSFLGTNGRNATFFLVPRNPIPSEGGGGGVVEEVDGTISGHLSGLDKYVIEPTDGLWKRVAYVETTAGSIYGGNPLPGPGGTLFQDGPYTITARPGDLAVVAVGGLRHELTGEFVPVRMGVVRFLFMPLRGTIEGADVVLDVLLDHQIAVTLLEPPYDWQRGPDTMTLQSWLEFFPEGFYAPHNTVEGQGFDTWVRYLPEPDATPLADVQLHLETGLYTAGTRPYSVVWTGSVPLATETLAIGPFVGIPRLREPTGVLSLTDEYRFAWTIQGGVEPDVYSLRMLGPDLAVAWRLIFAGPQRSFQLPRVPGVFEIPRGRSFISMTAGRAPVFSIDSFEYRHLSVRTWDAWSLDYVYFLYAP